MASSGNFCVLNPLPYSTYFRSNLGKGNLFSNPGNNCMGFGTMALTSGKKWYMEGIAQNAYNTTMGIFEINDANTIQNSLNTFYYNNTSYKSAFYHRDGTKYVDGSNSSYGATFAIGDVIGMAVDLESGTNTITFYKNNASQGSFNLGTNGLDYLFCMARGTSGGGWFMNFGQDSTFGGNKTAGGNADDSGFGDFFYAVPSGHLAVCSANLGISDDIDPAQTDDSYPAKNFNTVLFDGNGGSNAVTGLGFKPDLIWGFTRSGSQSKRVVDSTRGGSERLYSDLGDAASTGTATISEFGTDGFTATGGAFNNDSGKTCGSWCWKANGGTTTSFSAGGNQLAGTYQANTKSKFSIITYTGSGSTGEVLHGLGATPNFIIYKARNDTHWWGVYHKSGGTVNTGYDSLLYINSDNALASGQNVNIVPDSTKIAFAGNEQINRSSYNYVMYAWADVEGMQNFGTYEGNGNADGPFVYTGFRPRMLFTKRTENAGGWRVRDTARDTFNASTKISWWDSSSIEYSNSDYSIDILSNGFKIRTSSNDFNASEKWIYGAWGDVPFKYNNTF
jgi:hypothetical protein